MPDRRWLVAAAALAAVLVVVLVVVTHRAGAPAVEPVPHASTPAHEAANLETWLRRYSD